jgi:hypothetical protein
MKEQLEDAEHVAKGGTVPRFTKRDYDAAMLSLAKAEARPGESTAGAFARLCDEDPRMGKLYAAGERAEVVHDDREERELLAKHRAEMWPLMVKAARSQARDGETLEQALDRLLCTDPLFQRAYATTFAG